MTNGQHRGEPAHTAHLLIAGDRGVLAMDESMSTCNRRFAAAQQALFHRADCNRAARRGGYDAATDQPAAEPRNAR
jgi:fructose-bisphosphate aldolase class 1